MGASDGTRTHDLSHSTNVANRDIPLGKPSRNYFNISPGHIFFGGSGGIRLGASNCLEIPTIGILIIDIDLQGTIIKDVHMLVVNMNMNISNWYQAFLVAML
jgi:hypothetical protein